MALQTCLEVNAKKLCNFEELCEDPTYPYLNKNYREDRFPAPAQFFWRNEDEEKQDWHAEKLKVYAPPKVGNYFYITLDNGDRVHIRQKERNQFLKNEEYEGQMSKLITMLKERDTEHNIKVL